MNHTPRPWTLINPRGKAIYATRMASRDLIATTEVLSCADDTDESADAANDEEAANARLIAAAPEMLEALRDVEEAWTGNGDMATAVDAVLLAIAKATNQPAPRPDLPHDANCTYRLSDGLSECSCGKDQR